MPLATSVRMLVLLVCLRDAVADRVAGVTSDERGEIGSWMILAAGLAVAAVAAVAVLGPWFGQKTTSITRN